MSPRENKHLDPGLPGPRVHICAPVLYCLSEWASLVVVAGLGYYWKSSAFHLLIGTDIFPREAEYGRKKGSRMNLLLMFPYCGHNMYVYLLVIYVLDIQLCILIDTLLGALISDCSSWCWLASASPGCPLYSQHRVGSSSITSSPSRVTWDHPSPLSSCSLFSARESTSR